MATQGQPFTNFQRLSIGDTEAGAFGEALLGVVIREPGAAADVAPSNATEADAGGLAHFTLTTWVQLQGLNSALLGGLLGNCAGSSIRHRIFNVDTGALVPPVISSSTPVVSAPPPGNVAATNEQWLRSETNTIDLPPGTYRILTHFFGGPGNADVVSAFQDGTFITVMPYEPGAPGYL